MKLFNLLILLISSISVFSQCPDGIIVLESQYEVDLFTNQYPDCQNFSGTLVIGSRYGDGTVYDLSAMPKFKMIEHLTLGNAPFVNNYDFLQEVDLINQLSIINNKNIESLELLKNARILESVIISRNENMKDISDLNFNSESLTSFTLNYNVLLENCDLESLCELISKDGVSLNVEGNGNGVCKNIFSLAESCDTGFPNIQNANNYIYNQADIDSLQIRFPNSKKIDNLTINGRNDSDIISLEGLNFLDTIGSLSIKNCSNLYEINGVDSTVIYSLSIDNCINLNSLEKLKAAKRLFSLRIVDCENLATLGEANFNLLGLASLYLRNLPNMNNSLIKIDSLSIGLELSGIGWSSLVSFSNLKKCRLLSITSMGELESIQGINNLEFISYLRLTNLSALSDLSGFNNIKSTENISLQSMNEINSIANCFEQLETIHGNLNIIGNRSLDTINGFDNLKDVKGTIYIANNNELHDVNFLDKELNVNNSISIVNNINLSNCNLLGICDNLSVESTSFSGNLSGCNTDQNLLFNCGFQLRNPRFDLVINSQIELDSIELKYPFADSIYANVILLNNDLDSPISDLSFFNHIKYIEGNLTLDNFVAESSYLIFSNMKIGGLTIQNSDIEFLPYIGQRDTLGSLLIYRCLNLKRIDNLMGLKYIENTLEIRSCYNLVSLVGLDSLIYVNSLKLTSCTIQDISALENVVHIENLDLGWAYGFTSLEVLKSLDSIGYLYISRGDLNRLFLKNQIKSLKGLRFREMSFLNSIRGFERIKELEFLTLHEDVLDKVSGFDSLQIVYPVSGGPTISGVSISESMANSIEFPQLRKLSSLRVEESSFFEIELFENLDTIENVYIYNNIDLYSIDMFKENININSIYIRKNINLSACNVSWLCNNLQFGSDAIINSNSTDCSSVSDIRYTCGSEVRCPSSNISIHSNIELDSYLDRYGDCKVLPEGLEIDMSAISGNVQIDSLFSIGGLLKIISHDGSSITPNLSNIRNAEFVTMQEDFQLFYEFDDLLTLWITETTGLDSLNITIPNVREFYFINNQNLRVLRFEESIKGMREFFAYGNTELEKVIGPNTSIEAFAFVVVRNDDLQVIDGFQNTIIGDNGRVNVNENPILNKCNIAPLCQLLTDDVNVYSNGPLCSDLDTIALVCDGILSNSKDIEIIEENEMRIFPNPTNGTVYFQVNSKLESYFSGKVYNLWGVQMFDFKEKRSISFADLDNGVYFIKMDDNNLFRVIKSQ
jgi:hypothetical protein